MSTAGTSLKPELSTCPGEGRTLAKLIQPERSWWCSLKGRSTVTALQSGTHPVRAWASESGPRPCLESHRKLFDLLRQFRDFGLGRTRLVIDELQSFSPARPQPVYRNRSVL
jgi:hypothetical protein